MSRSLALGLSLVALVALTTACRQNAQVVETTRDAAPPPAAAPSAEASAAGAALPEGHPPMGGTAPVAIPPPPEGSGTGASALVWSVPATWVEEAPKNAMRRAQFRVPGSAGDAECVVYYFGPGQGGDAMSNAERWAGQFTQADGSSSVSKMKTREYAVGAIQVLEVEVTGSYGTGMMMGGAPTDPIADAMLLGAIASGPDANWFFKMTGPRATVEEQREAFGALMQSLRAGSQGA